MEKISWTGRVRSVEVIHRVKEERNILHAIKRRKVNWIGHILRKRFSKTIYWQKDRKTDRSFGRQGRRRKQLLDDLKETRGYWKMKEDTLDRTVWITRFGRGYGRLLRQTTE